MDRFTRSYDRDYDEDRRYRSRDYDRSRRRRYDRDYDRDDRGFMDRAADEVRSWFGDDDAERRRRRDHRYDRDDDRDYRGSRYHSRDYNDRMSYGSRQRDYNQRYHDRDDDRDFDYDYDRRYYDRVYGTGRSGSRDTDRRNDRDYGDSPAYGSSRFASYGREYNRDDDRSDYGWRRFSGDYDRRYGNRSGYNRGDYDRGNYERGDYDWDDYDQNIDYEGASGYGSQRYENDYSRRGGSPNVGYSYTEMWRIPGPHVGSGPKGYERSSDRTKEEICERLKQHGGIDASDIEISLENDEVTLSGTVPDRRTKRMAEQVAESASGIKDVHNRLRVQREESDSGTSSSAETTQSTRAGDRDSNATSKSTTSSTSKHKANNAS